MKRLWFMLMVVAALLSSTAATAEFYVIAGAGTVGTKITSLPCTISTPGFYFLGRDLETTGTGITVTTDNVTIDLMGCTLSGNSTAGNQGIVISGRSNVEIRNGTVRNFQNGIHSITSGNNCRIINIRALSNLQSGIKLLGTGHLITNCNASNNNGRGISQSGYIAIISNNVAAGNGGNGIDCTSGANLIGNAVYNNGEYGFNLSLATSIYYVIDQNTVFHNTSGNLNGTPPHAAFGINSGIP